MKKKKKAKKTKHQKKCLQFCPAGRTHQLHHGREKKPNPRGSCWEDQPCSSCHSPAPPASPSPAPPPAPLPHCPIAPLPRWPRGTHGPRLSRSALQGSGDGAWHRPRPLRPRSPFPLPKGTPRLVGRSPAVPSGCLGGDGESFAGFGVDGKVPALERGGTGVAKQISRLSALPFRKQLDGIQSCQSPQGASRTCRKRTFGVAQRALQIKVAWQPRAASALPGIAC